MRSAARTADVASVCHQRRRFVGRSTRLMFGPWQHPAERLRAVCLGSPQAMSRPAGAWPLAVSRPAGAWPLAVSRPAPWAMSRPAGAWPLAVSRPAGSSSASVRHTLVHTCPSIGLQYGSFVGSIVPWLDHQMARLLPRRCAGLFDADGGVCRMGAPRDPRRDINVARLTHQSYARVVL